MDEATGKLLLEEYQFLYKLCLHQSRLLRRLGQPALEAETGERILRPTELLRRTGLSKRTIYRLEATAGNPRVFFVASDRWECPYPGVHFCDTGGV